MIRNLKPKHHQGIDDLFLKARPKTFSKNQTIANQGDSLSEIHLITRGYVKAYTILDSGDMRTMFIFGPGDVLPITFSLTLEWTEYKLRYFYQALTEVDTKVLDYETFKNLVDTNSKLSHTYMNYMSSSNQAIMDQLEAMKYKSAKEKVAGLLPYLAKKLGKTIGANRFRLQIKLSHQEVADLSGITRETATTLIKKLERDGLIKRTGPAWVIKIPPDSNSSS